jgi:hypothetical protein
MPPGHIAIPKEEYESLLREVKRGVEVCEEVSALRVILKTLSERVTDKAMMTDLKHAVAACADVAGLRVELYALERRLREFDQELTPVRPPSRTDIKAAFENSSEFLAGRKKPPGSGA